MHYNAVIIGSGPGGYVSAIRCAQLGLKTAIIERDESLGGTCLNVGCIPSKTLLDSSEHFETVNKHAHLHGIIADKLRFDMKLLMKRKDDVITRMGSGIRSLMKKNAIDVFHGYGSFVDAHTVKVQNPEQDDKLLRADNIIIATGSRPIPLSMMDIPSESSDRIISSTEALSLATVPKSLVIIGAGAIGLEIGSIYSRLGSDVSVIEHGEYILPMMDVDISRDICSILSKQGIKFLLGQQVVSLNKHKNGIETWIVNRESQEKSSITSEYCLVAIGRYAFTEGLHLNKLMIDVLKNRKISVNENLQTAIPHIYAIGDVISGPMLAHKAEEEGVFVAEHIAGKSPIPLCHDHIPSVVYTSPEVSSVGKSEKRLKADGISYNCGRFQFRASGRAWASNETDGFVKVLSKKDTGEILGIHMIGSRAADLISEAVVALEYRASAEDIARIIHPHPTYSEALREAALDADGGRAIHK